MEGLVQLLPLVLIFVVFWLLVIRPAQNRNKATARLQSGLEVGDQVMLTSGLYGTLRTAGDDPLEVELAEGVVVRVARGAVARVVDPDEATPDGSADDEPAGDEEIPGGEAPSGPEER